MVQSVSHNQLVRWYDGGGRQWHFVAHAVANYAGLEAARLHPFIPPSLLLIVFRQYSSAVLLKVPAELLRNLLNLI